MKQLFNSKFIRLLVLLIVTISYLTALAQRFERHEVSLPDKGILTATVKIKPPYTFSIKKDNHLSWAKYEISGNFVFFTASVNTKKGSRESIFILVDGEGNPVDTLKLTQLGKVSTTASKLANRNTVKSSGGGQCAARTKKGTRCSRKAASGSIYCWQHNK
jgi:biopolymer transport protein ExbD